MGADLSGANLRGADMSGAQLNAENFDESIVFDPILDELNALTANTLRKDANVCGAFYDEYTIWPDDYDIPSCAVFEASDTE